MDIQFIDKGKGKTGSGSLVPLTPNTIDGLLGVNLVLSVDNRSILVKKSNITIATITLKKVVMWDLKSSIINVINGDPTILTLAFINNTERNIALSILEGAMNL